MIHPDTQIRYLGQTIGYGLFASKFIPKGTMVYVKDQLEIEISPKAFSKHSDAVQAHIEKYSYMDEKGVRVISWDFAKYVNHCCFPNTLSTAYNIDIAIRDIKEGEEITCDYGLLNVNEKMDLICSKAHCRKTLQPDDFDELHHDWDEQIKKALSLFPDIPQPLAIYLKPRIIDSVILFLADQRNYKSVLSTRFKRNTLPT